MLIWGFGCLCWFWIFSVWVSYGRRFLYFGTRVSCGLFIGCLLFICCFGWLGLNTVSFLVYFVGIWFGGFPACSGLINFVYCLWLLPVVLL